MTALVVGADALGNLPSKLRERGFGSVIHWNGRSRAFRTKAIPRGVEKVFVMCDYVNHLLMQSIKRQTKSAGIPVVYGKRSLADLEPQLR